MDYLKMKDILQRLNVTHEQMDSFWLKLIDENWKVKNLDEHGTKWYDLPEHLIEDVVKRGKEQ